MKLIDILVRDLHKFGGWPEGAVQCFRFVDEANIDFYDKSGNWPEDCFLKYGPFAQEAVSERKSPCASESVTREQYEAALSASKEMIINKPGSDGWISWRGGECPVDGDVVVDVKFRAQVQADLDGDIADNFRWEHFSNGADVVAYRLHKSEHQKPQWDGKGLPPAGCECEVRYRHGGIDWGKFKCLAIDRDIAFGWCADEPVTLPDDCYEFRPIRSEADKKRDEIMSAIDKALRECPHRDAVPEALLEAIESGNIPHIRIE